MRNLLILLLPAVIFLSGCSEENLRKAEDLSRTTKQTLVVLQGQIDTLEGALAKSELLGDSATAAKIKTVLSQVKEQLPIAIATAEGAADTLEAVRNANAAKWGVMEWVGTIVGTLMSGGGVAIVSALRAGRYKQAAIHGLGIAEELKNKARAANAKHDSLTPLIDVESVIDGAKRTQAENIALGKTITKLRKG